MEELEVQKKSKHIEYEPCGCEIDGQICGGKVIDDEPSLLPLDDDCVLKIIDQKCTKCGAHIVGKHQQTFLYHNKKVHDKLVELMEKTVRGGGIK